MISDTSPSLKSSIGKSLGPYLVTVSPESVRAFSNAVAFASETEIPPTFLTTFRELEFKLFAQLGIPLAKVLHAEQEYSYDRPLRIGMKLSYETHVVNVLEKRRGGGGLAFMVLETRFEDPDAPGPFAFSKTTIVIKDPFE